MATTLGGSTALVTGGGSGIGLACARRLAGEPSGVLDVVVAKAGAEV